MPLCCRKTGFWKLGWLPEAVAQTSLVLGLLYRNWQNWQLLGRKKKKSKPCQKCHFPEGVGCLLYTNKGVYHSLFTQLLGGWGCVHTMSAEPSHSILWGTAQLWGSCQKHLGTPQPFGAGRREGAASCGFAFLHRLQAATVWVRVLWLRPQPPGTWAMWAASEHLRGRNVRALCKAVRLKIMLSVIFNNVVVDEDSEVGVSSLGHFFLPLYRINTVNPGVFVWLGNAFQKYVNEVGIGVIKYFPIFSL